jgi:hypothetical protein
MQKLTLKLRDNQLNFRRVILLFVLYSIPPALAMLPITDPDIWWRLRTGQWIIEHKSAPVVDLFSTFSMGKPWIEYSWLFEVLVYAIHAHGSLTGLVYFVVTMAFVITFAAHKLVRQTSVPFAAEIALVVVGMMGMNYLMTPRPWLFTILFFIVELLIIDRARRSGKDGFGLFLWALLSGPISTSNSCTDLRLLGYCWWKVFWWSRSPVSGTRSMRLRSPRSAWR